MNGIRHFQEIKFGSLIFPLSSPLILPQTNSIRFNLIQFKHSLFFHLPPSIQQQTIMVLYMYFTKTVNTIITHPNKFMHACTRKIEEENEEENERASERACNLNNQLTNEEEEKKKKRENENEKQDACVHACLRG